MKQVLLVTITLALAGCESARNDLSPTRPGPAGPSSAAVRAAEAGATRPAGPAGTSAAPPGYVTSSQAFPTGDETTSALRLEKIVPAEVRAGQSFEYQMRVTNLSRLSLEGVQVRELCSDGFQVDSSEPKALSAEGGRATWNLGTIDPGAQRTIVVRATAVGEAALRSCADVEFTSSLCSSIPIVDPRLKLELAPLPEVLVCDEIALELSVTNTGSGVARDIVVVTELSEGLATAAGDPTARLTVESLAAGQSRTLRVEARAAAPGSYQAVATATMAGGVQVEPVERTIAVRQPRLEVSGTGPQTLIIGRDGAWEFTIQNQGDGVARDASFVATLQGALTVISSDPKAVVGGGKLSFDLGDMASGAARKVSARLRAKDGGEARVEGIAKAHCADSVTAATATQLKGIAATLLEVADREDPVLVGEEIVYEIAITNQGFAADHEVAVVCTLDEGMSFVGADGATAAGVSEGTITLAPLATLEPKQKATWTLRVKAESAGDKRFRVSVTSQALGRPVEETEATNLYQ